MTKMSKFDTIHQNKAEMQQVESESAFLTTWGYARFLHPPLSLLKLLPKVSWNWRQKSVDTYFSYKLRPGSMCAGKIQ